MPEKLMLVEDVIRHLMSFDKKSVFVLKVWNFQEGRNKATIIGTDELNGHAVLEFEMGGTLIEGTPISQEEIEASVKDLGKAKQSPYDRIYRLTKQERAQGFICLDWYKISDLVGIVRSRLNHAGKKILFGGNRGHKGMKKDINEAIWSLQEELIAIEREEELDSQ